MEDSAKSHRKLGSDIINVVDTVLFRHDGLITNEMPEYRP